MKRPQDKSMPTAFKNQQRPLGLEHSEQLGEEGRSCSPLQADFLNKIGSHWKVS